MKNNTVLYNGDKFESLWAALGYMPLMFFISLYVDKNSAFIKVHGIRSIIIFILFPLINLPLILNKLSLLPFIPVIMPIYKLLAIIFTFALLIDYTYCFFQASIGIYKKGFLVDKLFSKIINKYMYNTFFKN